MKTCGQGLERVDDNAYETKLETIEQIHTFTSNTGKLFEQRRFGLGCPNLYQVKWQEENEKAINTKNYWK